MKSNPLVSFIIPTYNSSSFLDACLLSLRSQTYKNIEIVIVDGKSTDNTVDIAKKYQTIILKNDEILAEPGVTLGFQNAKGEILIVMAVDNIFKEKDTVNKILSVFEDKKIYGAFPKHESGVEDNLFTKYTNIFTDPFNHFVYGYAANARTFKKVFRTIKHNDLYDIYDYNSAKVKPILALAQGFAVRKEFTLEKRNKMDDISPILNLINENKKIAYVHSVNLYHHTIKDMGHFIRKQRWAAKNALTGEQFGINSRSKNLLLGQKFKMYFFPIYSLSIVLPIINAIVHLVLDNEPMWLFHPAITFISGISIIYEYVRIKLGLIKSISRI